MVKAKRIKSDSMRNGKKPGSLLDHSDTDSEIEFALPPRKFSKPGKTFARRRGCSNCWKTCSNVLLVLLLVASVLSIVGLIWFSLRLKNDIDYLRKRVGYAESNSRSNSQEYKVFEKELDTKIQEAKVGEKEITVLQNQFHSLVNQIGYLNKTIASHQEKLQLPKNMVQLAADVTELKKGMADSGAANTKMTSEINNLKTAIQNHDQAIRILNDIIKNITSHFAEVSGKPIIQAPTPLPTLASNIQEKDNIVHPEKSSVDEMTKHFTTEIDRVMEIIGHVNQSLVTSVSNLKTDLKSAKDSLDNIKNQQMASATNSSETSVSSSELDNIRNKVESISSSMDYGLQKHNDSIISLANSLSDLKETTAHSRDNFTSELAILKVNNQLHVAYISNTTEQLQAAVQTNTENIKHLEETIKTLNTSNEQGMSFEVEHPALDESQVQAETVDENSEDDKVAITEAPVTETVPTEEPRNTSAIEQEETLQNETGATPVSTSESTNVTSNTETVPANSTAEEQEEALEATTTVDGSNVNNTESDSQTTDTQGELIIDENPTRVTRAIPEFSDDDDEEVRDLNSLDEPLK